MRACRFFYFLPKQMFLAKVTLFLSFGSQWERLKVEKDMGMDLKLMLQTAEFSSPDDAT